jgi:cyclic-di-GMP phosphodiesterase, flagellum assembly factor TipF
MSVVALALALPPMRPLLLEAVRRIDPGTAAVAAACLVLGILQIREIRRRRALSHALKKEINSLRGAQALTRKALDATGAKMDVVACELAQKSEAREKKFVGELQMIECLIRDFATGIARRAAGVKAAEEPQRAPGGANYAGSLTDPAMLEIVRRSLEDNRIDLYLQPIVSLPQRKVRYYEALTRLRSEDGAIIMPSQYIKIAAPAGLMSVVDNLLLFRCVQVVRRLTARSRDIAIFCNISGPTLSDREFFPQFLDFLHGHRNVAGQIVFEFPQDAVLRAGRAEEDNLRHLSGLGFRLSIDQVSDLDIDFGRAKSLGFHFFKLRADTLISGMAMARAHVAAVDFKAHLARNGLDLIVERIENERTVVQLLDFNVDFGQGYLFGEPRLVRDTADAHDPRTSFANNVTRLAPGLARRLAG